MLHSLDRSLRMSVLASALLLAILWDTLLRIRRDEFRPHEFARTNGDAEPDHAVIDPKSGTECQKAAGADHSHDKGASPRAQEDKRQSLPQGSALLTTIASISSPS